jgi:hypothetical protein
MGLFYSCCCENKDYDKKELKKLFKQFMCINVYYNHKCKEFNDIQSNKSTINKFQKKKIPEEVYSRMKKELFDFAKFHNHFKKNLIKKLLEYCENYPNEYINKYPHIITYKIYPCRLEENLLDLIPLLYE